MGRRPPNISTTLSAKKESLSPQTLPTLHKSQSAGLTKKRRGHFDTPYSTSPQSTHRYKTRLQGKISLAKNTYILDHIPHPVLKNSVPTPLCAYHFQVPGISVAFSDGDYDATSLVPEGQTSRPASEEFDKFEAITHVIRVSHLSARVPRRCHQRKYPPYIRPSFRNGHAWPDYDVASGVATLDLIIPRKPALISSTTRLTDAQILMAHDFFDLVLLSAEAPLGWPDRMNPRIPDPFNILITAPPFSPRKISARGTARSIRSQDVCLSQSSRDILALVEDKISPHSDILKARDVLSYLEGKLQVP